MTYPVGIAAIELGISRSMIEAKWKKKGKIEDPGSEVRCQVCGMYLARFPEYRSQISTADAKHLHFCSSQCLIVFLADPDKYTKDATEIKSIWVTVYPADGYEYTWGCIVWWALL